MGLNGLGFGTAGLPKGASKKDPIGAIQIVHQLGLDCLELEFAHGIRMKDETAIEINRIASQLGITLTAHAPYYINLNAKEQDKIDASINRLLQTARLAGMCGAYSMTFHAAFYMKDDPQTVFDVVKKYLKQITSKLQDESNMIQLRPELTGRKSQFGTLEELCELSKEVAQVYPALDFIHIQQDGKSNEEENNYEFFTEVFRRYQANLGPDSLERLHIHLACNEMGPKGETKHLIIRESTFNYMDFLRACRTFNIRGAIICDSPTQEEDAVFLKQKWDEVLKSEPEAKPASAKKIATKPAAAKTKKKS